MFFFYFYFLFLFIFGCIGSSLLCAGFLQLRRAGATLHCGARALGTRASVVAARGLQQLWLAGSRAQAQQLWHTGLVAPRHVGSSRTNTLEPMFPALAGGFLTTAPPGKSLSVMFLMQYMQYKNSSFILVYKTDIMNIVIYGASFSVFSRNLKNHEFFLSCSQQLYSKDHVYQVYISNSTKATAIYGVPAVC